MARRPRINIPHIPQHVIQRGNNKSPCFYHEQDYAYYLKRLLVYSQKHAVDVHAFVLMTNHVHLLLTPQVESGISRLMQSLGRDYVQYINKTYQRTGTLWEGRYKASLVDSQHYFLIASRYIELNPVRAKMVASPADYPWSSYQGNALGKPINLLTPHASYLALGENSYARQRHYRELFDQYLSNEIVDVIRVNTNKGWVIGSEAFKADIEHHLGRRIEQRLHGGDRRSAVSRDLTPRTLNLG